MISDIAPYCLRSRVKTMKRAAFFTHLGELRISFRSILGLLPSPPSQVSFLSSLNLGHVHAAWDRGDRFEYDQEKVSWFCSK